MKSLILALILFAQAVQAQSTSTDNTRVPPAPNIAIAATPTLWTLGAATTDCPNTFPAGSVCPANYILRNGVKVLDARGTQITWCQGIIYVLGRDKLWWKWTGTAWEATKLATIPCDVVIPPPPPPPPPMLITNTLTWTPGAIKPDGSNMPTSFKIYRTLYYPPGIPGMPPPLPVNVLLASVPPYTTTYTEQIPAGIKACYAVTAENIAGESPKSVEACK